MGEWMMYKLFIRVPFDKGYPHELVYGDDVSLDKEISTISVRAAQLLHSSGVPYGGRDEVPDVDTRNRTRALRMAMAAISKKARKMVLNYHPDKGVLKSWKWC